MKTGYSIKTWKMRLFCPEKQMIETTEALYREAVAFYYELLKESEELWAENLLTIQGHLEKLTVPGRDGREPKYIPPGGKLPVYFRRSAMNKAAMAVKTAASAESFPEKIDANITFFKGMYRDLTDTSVVLKLWNGKKWIWVPCGLTGRPFPKEAAILSPTLVHEEKWLMFHVPVKQENSDARTAKERMQEGARVCSVRFTNTDSFAVCTVLDEESRQLAVKNCRGGNAYRHHCKALMKKVEAYVMFMMSICMYMWQFVNKKTEKFFIITIYSLLCINLLLTLSRSIIICTIASQFLILYMMGARKLFKMIFKTIIFIIPILFIVTLFIPALGKTIKYGFLMIAALFDSKVASSISSAFGNDNLMGVGNRFDLYGWVSEKMAGHWLFGHGLYADFSYSFTQSNGFYSWIQTKDSIEVEYLNTLYQFGIFGMMTEVLSFLSVLGLNIKKYSSKLFFEKKISFNKIAFVTLIFYYLQLFAVNQSSDKYVFYIFVMFTIIYNGRVAQEK